MHTCDYERVRRTPSYQRWAAFETQFAWLNTPPWCLRCAADLIAGVPQRWRRFGVYLRGQNQPRGAPKRFVTFALVRPAWSCPYDDAPFLFPGREKEQTYRCLGDHPLTLERYRED